MASIFPSELVLIVARLLYSARDLLSLSLTCKRFHHVLLKHIRDPQRQISKQLLDLHAREVVEVVFPNSSSPSLSYWDDESRYIVVYHYNELPSGCLHRREEKWRVLRINSDIDDITSITDVQPRDASHRGNRSKMMSTSQQEQVRNLAYQKGWLKYKSDRWIGKLDPTTGLKTYADSTHLGANEIRITGETWYESEKDIPFRSGKLDKKTILEKRFAIAGYYGGVSYTRFQKTHIQTAENGDEGVLHEEFGEPSEQDPGATMPLITYITKDGKRQGKSYRYYASSAVPCDVEHWLDDRRFLREVYNSNGTLKATYIYNQKTDLRDFIQETGWKQPPSNKQVGDHKTPSDALPRHTRFYFSRLRAWTHCQF